jgi:hypothetical protein
MYSANPYAMPTANVHAQPIVLESTEFPPSITEPLLATRPWARVVSIVGFILSGLMVLGGIAVMAMTTLLPTAGEKVPAWVGLLYLVFAVFYIPPSLFLFRYASAITGFLAVPSFDTLGEALKYQKSFWKFGKRSAYCAAVTSRSEGAVRNCRYWAQT